MASQYYIHNTNPLEIYETNDFTLINTIDIADIITYKWYNEELLVLSPGFLIIVDPLEGEIDRIELNHEIYDITVVKDHIWGLYDLGVIEIKLDKSKLKTIKIKDIKQIITGNVGNNEIYLRGENKIYNMIKRQIHETTSTESESIGYIDDKLVIIKDDEVIIGEESYPHKDVIKVIKFEAFGFIFKDKVIYNDQEYKNASDVIKVNNELKFITKSNNGLEISKDFEDISSEKLSSKLTNNCDKDEIINYCNEVTDDEEIRSEIKSLTSKQQIKLYEIIISKISKNSLNNKTLSVWLKWCLIINKNDINSVKPKAIKNLNNNLSNSIQLMNNLLSIKGRLNLIKLQNDLKSKDLIIDQDFNNDDDSLYIANGENDEDFELDE